MRHVQTIELTSKRLKLQRVLAIAVTFTAGLALFNGLRATFISMMDEAGVQAHVTDCITGHAKQGMHGRYSQPSRDALMEAVGRAITPLGGVNLDGPQEFRNV